MYFLDENVKTNIQLKSKTSIIKLTQTVKYCGEK